MYLLNKYTKWYYQIVSAAQTRTKVNGYTEKHHIIPKSLGGSNSKSNLVVLTAREHFICHRLLTKMVSGSLKTKMVRAVWRMSVKGADFQLRYATTSRTYDYLRTQFGSLRKGTTTPQHVKDKISAANIGKIPWNKGIARTNEEKELMSQERKKTASIVGAWNQGLQHSQETKNKISEKAKSRTRYICSHCGVSATKGNYTRWHGDSCRRKPK